MRAWYQEFFAIPKGGHVREKVMLARVTVSVIIMLICLISVSFSAYAFFSCSISSGTTTIQSAAFDLTVTPPNGMEVADTYVLDNPDGSKYKEYTFKLSPAEESTATVGYAEIQIVTDTGVVQSFYTGPIWSKSVAEADPTKVIERTVTISVPSQKEAQVTILAQWGTCTKDAITESPITPDFKPATHAETPGSTTTAVASTTTTTTTAQSTTGESTDTATTTATTTTVEETTTTTITTTTTTVETTDESTTDTTKSTQTGETTTSTETTTPE